MIKYIATDLDGTLFYPRDKKHLVCKENLFFVQSFIDNGGKLILVSGRSIDYGKKVESIIGRDCVLIGYNGAVLFDNNKVLRSDSIDKEEAKEIIDDINKTYKVPAVIIMTEQGMYIHTRKHYEIMRFFYSIYNKLQGMYGEIFHKSEEEFNNAFNNDKIYKIMFFVGVTNRKKRQAMELNKMIRNAYSNIESAWCNQVIEISAENCSKGSGIREYCKLNNIKDDEICVVGDSGNDIPMFKEFPENSFCMSRAPETIKKYAKYTIDKYEDLSRYLIKK